MRFARNGKIRLNHNKIKEIIEKNTSNMFHMRFGEKW